MSEIDKLSVKTGAKQLKFSSEQSGLLNIDSIEAAVSTFDWYYLADVFSFFAVLIELNWYYLNMTDICSESNNDVAPSRVRERCSEQEVLKAIERQP